MVLRIQIGILNVFHWSLFERLIWKETCTLCIHDSDLYPDDHFGSRLCRNGLYDVYDVYDVRFVPGGEDL